MNNTMPMLSASVLYNVPIISIFRGSGVMFMVVALPLYTCTVTL